MFILSTIKITVKKVQLLIYEKEYVKSSIKFDYEVYISLHFLNIEIFKIKIDKEKLRKLNIQEKLKPKQIENLKNKMPNKNETKDLIKKLKIKLQNFNLNIEINTPDVMITTGSVAVLSTIISIILSKTISKRNYKSCKYKVTPLYTDKNILKIDFNCIIKVKIVHIIFIIYFLLYKKRRDDKNERTSNRRSYDYGYE